MKTAKKTLLVTRPSPDNKKTALLLREAGFNVELLPVLSFQALEFDLSDLEKFTAIAVSSTNALRALEQKDMLKDFLPLPLFAVGQKTGEQARALGFANVHTAGGNLFSLVELIAARHPGGPLFYPAARHLSGDLAAMLSGHDIAVKTVASYEMATLKQPGASQGKMIQNGSIDAALFYSRRSAQTFIKLCAFGGINALRLPVLCLSQNVADAFKDAGFTQIHISDAPNQRAMIALALSFAQINSK